MTTILQYLNELLQDQNIPDNYKKEMKNDREKLLRIINKIQDLPQPDPYFGGSKGKKTMIKESYDLDIVLYFPDTTDGSIQNIYDKVARYLGSSNYSIMPKNAAIRVLKRDNYHIDVVPAKRIKDSEDLAILRDKEKKWIQTSVIRHIASIREFGRRDVIKLLKLWKVRYEIEFPSFILEQLIIRALKNNLKLPLNDAIIEVFEFVSENMESIRLVDPANSNNILTDSISAYDKDVIAQFAGWVLKENDLSSQNGWINLFNPKKIPQFYQSTGAQGRIRPNAPSPPRFGN